MSTNQRGVLPVVARSVGADISKLLLELSSLKNWIHCGETNQSEEVTQHGGLDLHVDGRVGVEGGGHVDLQQPGLQIRVNQNIKTIHFKTIVSVRHEHLARAVHRELHRDNALDDHILDGLHQVGGVEIIGAEMFEEGGERPLVTSIIILNIVTGDVVRVILVDAVVAEVHARVPQVAPRVVVLDRGEPHQALLVQVDDEGVVGGDEHVQSQI